MTSILFIDDDLSRHSLFRSLCPSATFARTVDSAIDFLGNGREWDVVLIDHDMAGEPYQDSEEQECGMAVVRWLEEREEAVPVRLVVCHSHNGPAADEMASRLSELGYNTQRVPFADIVYKRGYGKLVAYLVMAKHRAGDADRKQMSKRYKEFVDQMLADGEKFQDFEWPPKEWMQ